MEKQIIISDERILYEISIENEIVKCGFNYIRSSLMTLEEVEKVLESLHIPLETLNEQIFSSSIEH